MKIKTRSSLTKTFRVDRERSVGEKFGVKFTGQCRRVSARGRRPGEPRSEPSTPLLLVPWAESDQGRWRLLTIPGPKLPNSDGRISSSDGWVRRRIGPDRRAGTPWVFLGLGGPRSASRREPCLWPPAPPGIGRRWRCCSGREPTSTTPTSTDWQPSIRYFKLPRLPKNPASNSVSAN